MRRLGYPAVAVLLGGCVVSRSAMSPASPGARTLADLGWPMLVGFCAVSVMISLLLVWLVLRAPGSFDSHLPIDDERGRGWIYFGGILVPAVVFATLFVATLVVLHHDPHHAGDHASEIRVIGHQWWWEVVYDVDGTPVTTANELHVPVGRSVRIELRSADVIHSFWVPRLQGKVDLIPGHPNHIEIQADRAGTYAGACAEYCGQQHAHMRFLVIADPPEVYEAWRRTLAQDAAAPTSASAQRGAAVFQRSPCPLCHTIRGTTAHGRVGPDLTHLAGRSTLAAGSWPKDLATLHAWILNAPALKPGVRMPPMTRLSGAELGDLVDYLQELP